MRNISKNVIKPAFTVRCCSSNKCETLSISIFSRLGIECKSTSKFVCCRMKERKGEKWVLQNVVPIKAISLFLIKSCGFTPHIFKFFQTLQNMWKKPRVPGACLAFIFHWFHAKPF